MNSARYYSVWQGDTAKLVQRLQHLSLYILVALAIASGVEGSNYTDPSDLSVAQKLSQAYSILFMFFVLINAVQWGNLWLSALHEFDILSLFCTISLVMVFLKALYLIVSSWVVDISVRNPFINAGWYAGGVFATDFLASLFIVLGGLFATKERVDASREYTRERNLQDRGGRYQYDSEPNKPEINYSREA
jgi:hypothetical protein